MSAVVSAERSFILLEKRNAESLCLGQTCRVTIAFLLFRSRSPAFNKYWERGLNIFLVIFGLTVYYF